jgi:hypothetical protein
MRRGAESMSRELSEQRQGQRLMAVYETILQRKRSGVGAAMAH